MSGENFHGSVGGGRQCWTGREHREVKIPTLRYAKDGAPNVNLKVALLETLIASHPADPAHDGVCRDRFRDAQFNDILGFLYEAEAYSGTDRLKQKFIAGASTRARRISAGTVILPPLVTFAIFFIGVLRISHCSAKLPHIVKERTRRCGNGTHVTLS
jgi:hypothetical protein